MDKKITTYQTHIFTQQMSFKKQILHIDVAAVFIGSIMTSDILVALIIFNKLLNGPLWKKIESAKHMLDLYSMWLTFGIFLDDFSRDSSYLLIGTISFPEFTIQDEIVYQLFSFQDEQLKFLQLRHYKYYAQML